MLYLLDREGVETGVDLDALIAVAKWLEALLGRELPGRVYRPRQARSSPPSNSLLLGFGDADDAGRGELGDLDSLVARLAEDLGGVLAEERRRAAVLTRPPSSESGSAGSEVRDRRVGEALDDPERLGLR